MNLVFLTSQLGDTQTACLFGLLVGLGFGWCAERSRFCLRSATIEFWRGEFGPKVAVWLLTFFVAVTGTQALLETGLLSSDAIRQLSSPGTLSGAVIGGALFGCGMMLARGCASRLLVLAATGNLRALVTGMVLTVVAQASLRGILSPLREALSRLWVVDGAARDLLAPLPHGSGLALAGAGLAGAAWLAHRRHLVRSEWANAVGVGLSIVAGWYLTFTLSQQSFELIPVQSVTFTGPSADTLMALVNEPRMPLNFGIGLVLGVFTGALAAALASGEFAVQGFDDRRRMPRYLIGAGLMGFGGMLAGGCAVGAGVTGGSVFALTAWVALLAMWLSAGVTGWLLDDATHASAASVPGR